MTNVEQANANTYWRIKANEEIRRSPSLTFNEALAVAESRLAKQIKAANRRARMVRK